MWGNGLLINLIVGIPSQCIHVSNHYVVLYKYSFICQSYLNKAEKKEVKKIVILKAKQKKSWVVFLLKFVYP